MESYGEARFEAGLSVTGAVAQMARFSVSRPTDRVFFGRDRYWIDMCLTPRPEHARGGYRERWGPTRYERLGEIFLVPPGEALHVLADDHPLDQLSIVCEIEAETIERWLPGPIEWTDPRLAAGLDIAHPNLRACLLRLAEEIREPGIGSLQLTELLIRLLVIEIARYCEATVDRPASGGLASWRLRIIDKRVLQPGAMPSLEELADLCGLSVRQLTRGFRASRRCSVGDHIAQTRITMGKQLLAGPASIKEVALELGFSSTANFSSAFRRTTGLTPREFRSRQLRDR